MEWPKEFPIPEPPLALLHIWDWYWDLRSSGSVGFSGPNPLSYSEIHAWAQLMQIDTNPRMIHFLRVMDSEYLNAVYKQMDKPKKTTTPKPARRKR